MHGAPIQILDLPGIIEGAKDGRGRGRQVIAVARSCNLLFIVLDVLKPMKDKAVIENELEGFGIRLNKKPANILIKKKDKGGITISNTVPLTKMEPEEIKAVLAEYRLSNCDISIRQDASLDELIDVIEGNRVYLPCLYVLHSFALLLKIADAFLQVLNKIDAISIEELDLLYRIPNSVPISAKDWMNIDELIQVVRTGSLIPNLKFAERLAPHRCIVLRCGRCARPVPPDYECCADHPCTVTASGLGVFGSPH